MIGRALRAGVVLLAVAAAVVPLPRWAVERWYSRGLYPTVQYYVTSVTNQIPVALLDVAIGCLVVFASWRLLRLRRARGGIRAIGTAAAGVLTFVATAYLAFLVLWGLNYRRVPLKDKLELDESRVTEETAIRFASDATHRINALYSTAHLESPPGPSLAEAFGRAQTGLGASATAVPGVPKASLLEAYFRWAAIDGMTNPFFLEIIVNPEVLPIEGPFVLAHEWAHLAGYADESEANLVAWLTCLRGDALAEYSGWMAMFGQVVSEMPPSSRRRISPALAPGPREDFREIAARWARSRPVVRNFARETYDVFLRANRVEAGIASYDQVVRLILSTGPEHGWVPRVRQE
jgi:hypothetical protein